MGRVLIIIGHHREETEFGQHLRAFMEPRSDFPFYRVQNSYSNGDSGQPTPEEIQQAEEEIFAAVASHQPDIVLDVHTAFAQDSVCLVELITLHQFSQLRGVSTSHQLYPVDNRLNVHTDKFQPIKRKSTLHNQKEFPFATLEIWLHPEKEKPPYLEEVRFASEVIKKVSVLY